MLIAGYGNEEIVPLKKLQPSEGQAARKLQEAAAAAQDVNERPVSPVGLKVSSVAEGLCRITALCTVFTLSPTSSISLPI